MTNILICFSFNSLKANPGKFQFLILGLTSDKFFILTINAIEIRTTNEVELLGLKIDYKLKSNTNWNQIKSKSDTHIDKLSKTARFKLKRTIRKFLTHQQANLLANSFVSS